MQGDVFCADEVTNCANVAVIVVKRNGSLMKTCAAGFIMSVVVWIGFILLTDEQIEHLQRIVTDVQRHGFGIVIIQVENGLARYIIPAPSINFLTNKSLRDYIEDRKQSD